MSVSIGSSRSLPLGVVLSVFVHVLGAAGLARYGTELVAGTVPAWGFHVPEPDPLVLGIEDSPHKTDTWLGFKDPTEHSGPLANTEQAAMTRAPGSDGILTESVPAPTSPEPKPAPAPNPAASPAAAPAEPSPAKAPARPDPAPAPEPLHDPTAGQAALEGPPPPEDQPASVPPTPPSPPTPATEPVRPSRDAVDNPSAASPAGKPVTGDQPGEKTDRESTPSSTKQAIEVVPGRPAAAKGLEIKTIKPRWTEATKLTAAPRNPVVRVTFVRTGKVSRAAFVAGENTGWKDVDEPLLDAIYRWTAKGEALNKLKGKDDGLTVEFRIMLR